jgi:hypothetical protein
MFRVTQTALRVGVAVALVALALALAACGDTESGSRRDGGGLDPTPEKLDGSSSQEFEQDDIEQAESASPEVQEYCEGAVSEAQELGCLSHVEESDPP